MFAGVFTALATPFDQKGRIDWDHFERLVQTQIEAGVDGLVPVGTTGESPTLSAEECHDITSAVVRWANGRVPVIVGAGSNSTCEAIRKAQAARRLGVDATMQVVPYYNKPTQAGLFRHFMEIADTVDIPLVVYNVPIRSGVGISTATILDLSKHERITTLKDAGGNVSETSDIVSRRPEGFSVLSGEDGLTFPMMALGAEGVISVLSNIFPKHVVRMVRLCRAGEWGGARNIHFALQPIIRLLFEETNPIPLKAAMAMRFGTGEYYRLPLVPISPDLRARLAGVVEELSGDAAMA